MRRALQCRKSPYKVRICAWARLFDVIFARDSFCLPTPEDPQRMVPIFARHAGEGTHGPPRTNHAPAALPDWAISL